MSVGRTRTRVRQLMEMLRVQALLEQRMKAPSFSHALGLNYAQLDETQFVPVKEGSDHFLSFQYTVPPQLRLPYMNPKTKALTDDSPNNHPVSLATLLAILDEVTSWSGLIGDVKRRRFGVSVNLRAEWSNSRTNSPGSGGGLILPGQTIQVNTTNSKIGKNIGFIRAEFCDAQSGEMLAFGSHVKYLDQGPLLNLALLHWPVTKVLFNTLVTYDAEMEQRNQTRYQLPHLFQSLVLDKTKYSFTPDKIHGSLGGPLHGGCQSVLHELVGSGVAQETLQVHHVKLESIQVDYLSTPAAKADVEFDVQVLSPSYQHSQPKAVCIRTSILSRGKISSQANLTFVPAPY